MRDNLTYEEIVKVNEAIQTTDIKGKEYAEVNQRIKAFRMLFPLGKITTEMISNENGVCVFKCVVYNGNEILATGHAYEKEGSTFINKTSYIENCETSAVGRALGMCGIGIDTSVASYEEVANAIENQKPKNKAEKQAKNESLDKEQTNTNTQDKKQFKPINEAQRKILEGLPLEAKKRICDRYNIPCVTDLSSDKAAVIITNFIAKGILKKEEQKITDEQKNYILSLSENLQRFACDTIGVNSIEDFTYEQAEEFIDFVKAKSMAKNKKENLNEVIKEEGDIFNE